MDKPVKKKELWTIGEIIGETLKNTLLQETMTLSRNDYIRKTKARIRSYPQLKRNIERYQLDIEDIKHENFGKSKSIVIPQPTYANPLTIEDKRAASIAVIEKKLERDQREIKYIELALEGIKENLYYEAFELYYFKNMTYERIAMAINASRPTVTRNVNQMTNQVAVFFYGAEVFQ